MTKQGKCPKCENGWIEDGNAAGHAGVSYYPCDCPLGLERQLAAPLDQDKCPKCGFGFDPERTAVSERRRYLCGTSVIGDQVGESILCLRNQIAQHEAENVRLRKFVGDSGTTCHSCKVCGHFRTIKKCIWCENEQLQKVLVSLQSRDFAKAYSVALAEWFEEHEMETSPMHDCKLADELVSSLRAFVAGKMEAFKNGGH